MVEAAVQLSRVGAVRSMAGLEAGMALDFCVEWELPTQGEMTAGPMAAAPTPEVEAGAGRASFQAERTTTSPG